MRLRFLFVFSTAFWVAAIGVAAQDASPVTSVPCARISDSVGKRYEAASYPPEPRAGSRRES